MASLSSLVVSLEVQHAQLRRGLDEANARLDSFAKKAESAGQLLTGAITFEALKRAATTVADFMVRGVELADSMGNMAKAAGAPVREVRLITHGAPGDVVGDYTSLPWAGPLRAGPAAQGGAPGRAGGAPAPGGPGRAKDSG